jgi:D-alanyl-D-alanine carboxypeptidase/D-alanyl-D-alanine-endopeptidase (penicillin-binding protein 4)
MQPASTLKVLTTSASLDLLGPDFHWRTALLAAPGARRGDTLHGPLYLRGGGAPDLDWRQLDAMLAELRAQGVRRLDGDLVLDRGYFSPQRFDLGVPPFDSTPGQAYNVIPNALTIHNNLLDLHLVSDASHVKVTLMTPLDGVEVVSQLTLSDQPCADWDEEWPLPQVQAAARGRLRVILRGDFPRHCSNHTATNVIDPDQYTARLLRALWQARGGSWHGAVRGGATPAEALTLVQRDSAPLAEIVRTVNKRSDNVMARLLYLSMGHAAGGTPTLAAADGAVRGWLRRHAIDDSGLVLENGSGLSRLERTSPDQLAAVLRAAARSPWSAELAASLPIAGVDGARRPLLQALLPGSARIKGGTLNNTVSAAGYVRDLNGCRWVVAAMINRPQAEAGRGVLDALIAWIAQQPAGAPAC